MSGAAIPSPVTPQLRSPKLAHCMIRRASTIKGLAFTEDDFEMGPQIGSGFFGKVRKVSAHFIYEIFCPLVYICIVVGVYTVKANVRCANA